MPPVPPSAPRKKSLLDRAWTRAWRQPAFRQAVYNGLSFCFAGLRDWQVMNCGYLPGPAETAPEISPRRQSEALGLQLYARAVRGVDLAGAEVLEIGSGRGGGSQFLSHSLQTRRWVGLDYAATATRFCRREVARPGLEFATGNALRLPFPDRSFDAVVSVETSHCIFDKRRFLGETARVLRPGGVFCYADFFYRRETAEHALGKLRAALAESPFTVEREEELTAGVLAALEADSERRAELIGRSLPRVFRGVARGFCGTTESSTYRGLAEGRTVYLRFVLRRSAASGA